MAATPWDQPQLDWSSEFINLVWDLMNRQLMTGEGHIDHYHGIYEWTSSLATAIHDLLDPRSSLATANPLLHEVLARRYSASMEPRPDQEVSKCSHLCDGAYRTDSYEYQYQIHTLPETVLGHGGNLSAATRYHAGMCSILKRDFVIRGIVGVGTFGVVFLAHKRDDDSKKLYAIKVEPLSTINTSLHPAPVGFAPPLPPTLAPLYNPQDQRMRYIPVEAFVLLLVDGCDKFPKLDSVYSHQFFSAMVMEAHVDEEVQNRPYNPNASIYDWLKEGEKFPTFNGAKLLHRKRTRLNEIQACKVASHLFEATAYLRDMRLCNTDLSHNNYLVDEQLNTRMIDLGQLHFGLRDEDFYRQATTYIPFYEKFMTPELAIEFTKAHWIRESARTSWSIHVDLPHDIRRLTCWQLAAIIYELLHGFAPWEEKEWNERIGGIVNYRDGAHQAPRLRKVRERRGRIINEDLPIDEYLSQDCVDALQMMFVKDPEKRPTLEEMASFTWFGQWSYHSAEEFQRPAISDS